MSISTSCSFQFASSYIVSFKYYVSEIITIISFHQVLELLSVENMALDMLHGGIVVTCTLLAFIGLVWLREQILHGGALDWFENPPGAAQDANVIQGANAAHGVIALDNNNQHPINWQVNFKSQYISFNFSVCLFLFETFHFTPTLIFKDPGEGVQGAEGDPGNAGEAVVDADAAEAEVAAAGDPVAAPGEAAADEANWNPIEWDRAAEDLTWERLLGLDGSLVCYPNQIITEDKDFCLFSLL